MIVPFLILLENKFLVVEFNLVIFSLNVLLKKILKWLSVRKCIYMVDVRKFVGVACALIGVSGVRR